MLRMLEENEKEFVQAMATDLRKVRDAFLYLETLRVILGVGFHCRFDDRPSAAVGVDGRFFRPIQPQLLNQ